MKIDGKLNVLLNNTQATILVTPMKKNLIKWSKISKNWYAGIFNVVVQVDSHDKYHSHENRK